MLWRGIGCRITNKFLKVSLADSKPDLPSRAPKPYEEEKEIAGEEEIIGVEVHREILDGESIEETL